MAEITRKSVLLECLSIMREEQRIMSKNYNCLEPADGMEEAWNQGRRKIQILEEHIQALDSEPVLRALAGWQKEEKPPKDVSEEFSAAGITFEGYTELRGKLEKADLNEFIQKKLDHEDGTLDLR